MRKGFITSFVLLFCFASLAACQSQNKELTIQNAWGRPGVSGSNSAVYFTIDNPLSQSNELKRISSDVAESVELHMSSMDANGIMMMRPVESIEIPAKSTVDLKPGGLHVMLVGLKQDLITGGSITINLDFENTGSLTIEVPIKQSAD